MYATLVQCFLLIGCIHMFYFQVSRYWCIVMVILTSCGFLHFQEPLCTVTYNQHLLLQSVTFLVGSSEIFFQTISADIKALSAIFIQNGKVHVPNMRS